MNTQSLILETPPQALRGTQNEIAGGAGVPIRVHRREEFRMAIRYVVRGGRLVPVKDHVNTKEGAQGCRGNAEGPRRFRDALSASSP